MDANPIQLVPDAESALERPIAPDLWALDPRITFLNHGSFGACPRPVLAFQQALRERMEAQPVQFLARELEGLLDAARHFLATFVGADPEGLVFVPNATTGVNTALRAFPWQPGDELILTNHAYNACRNAVEAVARASGAQVRVAEIPFPLTDPGLMEDAIWSLVTGRTRLVFLDHVTSPTALIWPLDSLVPALRERGIETLVDGAHAPGMIPLDLERLGAAFYTGNCHKWLCAPKGAAFLYARADWRERLHPLVISHGANSPRRDRSRLLLQFGWTGTCDPTAYLSVPEAIQVVASLLPGGWPQIMGRNRALTLAARQVLGMALEQPAPCPDACLGSLASFALPSGAATAPPLSPLYADPLQQRLLESGNVEIPIIPWPTPPQRLVRFSCHLYNALPHYRHLATVLVRTLEEERSRRKK